MQRKRELNVETSVRRHWTARPWQCSDRVRSAARKESGSIAILTLFAFALLTAAFIYVAVIGSRSAETTRARTSADATAMASATIKAKVMNYESFLLLAESILLPLEKVTSTIRGAQAAAELACVGASIVVWSLAKYCVEYLDHIRITNSNLRDVSDQVGDWLDGLSATAEELQSLGPLWAEWVAAETGMSESYVAGEHGVTVAASFPIPRMPASAKPNVCEDMGLEMVGADADNGGKTACRGQFNGALQIAYILSSLKPVPIIMDLSGTLVTGAMLSAGARCHSRYTVPRLRDDWRKFRMSRGMSLIEHPSDQYMKNLLSWADPDKPKATLHTGYLLGMGCAEHYSQHNYGSESLWNMDWRARLVPCDYANPENVAMVERCWIPGLGNSPFAFGKVPLLFEQFNAERLLGISKHWRY